MSKGLQSTLEFYKDQEITEKPRVGQIVIARHYIFSNVWNKPGKTIYVPQLIVDGKVYHDEYRNFKPRNKNDYLPLTTTFSIRSSINRHNWSCEWNRPPEKLEVEFLTRATKKNVKVGDNLIRIVKLRKRYKSEEITYDGTMSVRGYFIHNEE
jgi:hypothetical protein